MASKQSVREEDEAADLKFGREFLVLTHDLAQEFGSDNVHGRLAVLSVHHTGELFQL